MNKTDFFITYHHSDEMAARWIAAVLKQAQFSTLSDSWDFLSGETPLEKIEYMFGVSRNVMVLISRQFFQSQVLNKSFLGVQGAIFQKSPLVAEGMVFVRIDSCDIRQVLGAVEYLDLWDIDEKEAEKRLLEAVGGAKAEQKKTVLMPGSAGTQEEILAKRKQELDQLLVATIKHNYHMKLDLEQEVEKEIEVKNEKTGKMEKRKEWVWETVSLDTVLQDGKNYILVNPSGLGKTTFLTYAACALLDQDAHYPFLPLFFTCIGLNSRAGTIENFIQRQVESFYTGSQGSLVSGEWENLCVLMDALDQARDVDDIVSSLQFLNKPLHYKKSKIILSSRQNTADKVKEGFAKIRLRLPEADEVRHYLGEGNYKKLAGIIEASGELVKAPVLLEMLKTITEKGHVVSTLHNRADLYTEFTRVLLDQERSKPRFWQDRLSIRHFIDFELEQALEKIAFFSLAENEILEIPKEKLAQYCESLEKKESLLNIGILLELFEDREQKIVFRHQSFQAYFAARYMYYRQPQLFQEITSDIVFFYNDVWYEVIRFFVSLEKDSQKAEDIIDTIYQIEDQKLNLNQALRLIFAVFLMSEAQVIHIFAQRVYKQLGDLLKNNKQYWESFNSNIDKFNTSNDEQRRNLFTIFTPLLNDKYVRSSAANALVSIVIAQDVPLLEPLLRDESEYVRRAAVEALGNIGTSKNIPLLEPLLKDKDEWARVAAAQALAKIGTANDIPLLESLLRDNQWVRRHAAEALGEFGTVKEIPLLEPLFSHFDSDVRKAAEEALEKIVTAGDIPLLESLFRDEDSNARSAAARALGKIGTSKDIPLLEPLLRDRDVDVLCSAARALGDIGTSEHFPLLEPLLSDKNEDVRETAAGALYTIVSAKDIPLLESLLRDENGEVRSAAVYALGKIGAAEHIPLLEPLLRDENGDVRKAAVIALGMIGNSEHIPLLEPLLRDGDWNVLHAATYTLGEIGNTEHIPLLEPILSSVWDEYAMRAAAYALGNLVTAKDIHLLVPPLRSFNKGVCLAAAKAFKKIVKTKDIPLLESMLKETYFYVVYAAVEALGKIGNSDHITLLIPLLFDDDVHIRCYSAIAFGKIGTTKDIPLLEPLLRDESEYVRRDAVEAIEQIYKRSTPVLRIPSTLLKEEKKVLPLKLFSAQTLHILHISDIHYALEKDPTINCIFHEFLEDIKKWRGQQSHTKIQAICLTGDIAQAGQNEQYDSINEKINALLETTCCTKENLFIIPGNHDVQEFDKICAHGKSLLEQAGDNKINIDTAVLSSDEHYRLFHDKFANYYKFIKKYGYLSSLPDNHHPIPSPWYNRKLKDFPVRIMGLNSALFCLQGFIKYGDIRMGTHQFQEAYFQGKAGDWQAPEVVILLTHHPLNWLAETEYDEYSTLMERYAVLHLHGHIHKTHIEKKQRLFSSSGGYVSIGTGSLYGEKGKEDINTYHIITLDFENQELHVWARRWNPDTGKWTVYDDDGNNRFRLPVAGGR